MVIFKKKGTASALTYLVAIFATLLQFSVAHKVLLLNDIHLDLESTEYYSMAGTETNVRTLNLVLQEAAKEEA